MSGGVGPTCSDIALPREEKETEQKQQEDPQFSVKTKDSRISPAKSQRRAGFLSFRQLNSLAVIVVFSASGLVSLEDLSFVIFSIIYMYFISKVAFPNTKSSKENIFNSRLLKLYVFVGAVVGLFLPIAYIFEGIFEGDKEGIKAAAPHVFLLASQIFMEGLAFSDRFSTPVRVFVPVFYNSRRIFTLADWLRTEVTKVNEEHGGSARRVYIGRALAMANMAFWCFNLFGFLLPVYLPRAFRRYYSGNKIKD